MGVKREEYRLKKGNIIDIREFYDGRYGAPGKQRKRKEKPTEEQMRLTNDRQKIRRCRLRILTYFHEGDCFVDLTYKKEKRPSDMKEAVKDFQRAIRKIRREYKRAGYELFWIRNIERGEKGAWHIHLILNRIEITEELLRKVWEKDHGHVWSCDIKDSPFYGEDCYRLANYMTKNQYREKDPLEGEKASPKPKEANYSTSRNMPLPKPKVQKLAHWQQKINIRKGYYITSFYENKERTYKEYTLVRIKTKDGS